MLFRSGSANIFVGEVIKVLLRRGGKIMDWLANKKLFKTSFDQQLIPCNEKIFQKNIIEFTTPDEKA